MKSYEPGQSNIDGGGFDIVTFDPKAGYMYVQFESLKNGFIDDLELALVGDEMDKNAIQVRSSSRLGYVSPFFVKTGSRPLVRIIHSSFHLFLPFLKLDFGVNAKRINYLAKNLRSKGWDAPGVEFETHRGYAEENGLKSF